MNRDIEERSRAYIQEHPVESKASALKVQERIAHSELNAGHTNITHTLHIPKYFSQRDRKKFQDIVSTMMPVFYKTIDAYRQDPEVRALFPFDERLQELILLEATSAYPIPVSRVDIFYNEETGDFKFCEFNTDGTSAMNENRRLTEFLEDNNVFQALQPAVDQEELIDPLIDALLEVWHSASRKLFDTDRTPSVVITDFLDKAYLSELKQICLRMNERGIPAEVTDIRDLVYEDGRLKSAKTGTVYDLVYRRAVTKDIMEGYDSVTPFLDAMRNEAMVMAGPLSTQVIHHKAINMALLDPILQKYFTEEEQTFLNEHLPKTYRLTKERAEEVLKTDKDRWILKPEDSYAARGVFCGQDLHQNQWEREVQNCADRHYLVQEYVEPYQSPNVDLLVSDAFIPYTNMTGLYVYNGDFAGVYSRLSDGRVVSTQYNEKAIPTLFVKEDAAS